MKASTLPASARTKARNATIVGTSDPQTTTRDEKINSSSQSHNNTVSCSSDHAKMGEIPVKEDARSSAAGSGTVTKISGSSSRHQKFINGLPGPLEVQRETGPCNNSSLHRNSAPGKISQSSLTCERAVDAPIAEGNGNKFIVKIPNRGRGPAQSVSGGFLEDQLVTNSRASSPVLSEKQEQFKHNMKEKSGTYQENVITDVNNESWQSNDVKDLLTGSDEGESSPAAVPDEEYCRTGEDLTKITEVTKVASSSSGNEIKSRKMQRASLNSINTLIDSFVKYTKANACMPVADDAGMNLLASVAAGEIPKSDVASRIDSPQRNAPVVELSSMGNDTTQKPSVGYEVVQDQNFSVECVYDEHLKQSVVAGKSWAKNADSMNVSSQETSGVELNEQLTSSIIDLPRTAEHCLENGKVKEITTAVLVNFPSASTLEKTSDIGDSKEHLDKKADAVDDDGRLDIKQKNITFGANEDKVSDLGVNRQKEVVEGSSSAPSMEVDVECKTDVTEGMDRGSHTPEKSPAIVGHSTKGTDKKASPTGSNDMMETFNVVKAEKDVEADVRSQASDKEKRKPDWEMVPAQKVEHMEENLEGSECPEPYCGLSPYKASILIETEQPIRLRGSNLAGVEERTSTTADTPATCADAKVKFDLNEGFSADDGKFGEPINLAEALCPASVQLINPTPLPVSFASNSVPASITVTAAAKGPFVPPDDLLRSKGALGWKGSAATSAFRPAARKILEMPLGTSHASISEATTGKQSRPPLDIDLNVPDERLLDDLASRSSALGSDSAADLTNNRDLTFRSSGGLDLDLNRVDVPVDLGNLSTGNNFRLDVHMQPIKSSSCGIFNGEASLRRDFDLNNGPILEEVSAALVSQRNRSSNISSQPPVSSLRINNSEIANFSSWFPTGNTYSAVTLPSILFDREPHFPVATGGPQRVLGPDPPTGASATPFNSDAYRGPVLSSSLAVPYLSTPFQYPTFPFGATFPLPSTSFPGSSATYSDSSHGGRICLPSVHAQLLGPAGAVLSHYPRPYVVSLVHNNGNSIAENGRKWGRQGLDLNAGPGGLDIEGRDETTALASRQLSVVSSQALAKEQARIYQVAGDVLKKKELEGCWDGYKQS